MEQGAAQATFSTGGAKHTTVAIVGSGFAGIGAAVKLGERGVDYTVFERAYDVGGTWRDNAYPGCQCDVPSHLYSFSFALNPHWTRTYPLREEIWAYLKKTAEGFGVLPHVRFGHEVLRAAWDEEDSLWRIDTSSGSFTADVLVSGMGALSEPALPAIAGLGNFEGSVVHSADWEPGHDLASKRVAVIGTGASAIQIVPEIQPVVGSLILFQRTAPWVLPHTDRPLHRFENELYRRVPLAQRLVRWGVYWSRELLTLGFVKRPPLLGAVERRARRHLDEQVRDPELRAKLTPSYAAGCKRLLLSNTYYLALGAPNVQVVTSHIDSVTPRGIVTDDGVEHEVDAIFLGTGFKVTDNPAHRRVLGTGGRSLYDAFCELGMSAYLGTTIPGFPNFFVLAGPNTGIGHTSLVFMIEAQIRYLVDAIGVMSRNGSGRLEVRHEPFAAYNRDVQRRMEKTVWTQGGCSSWYLDDKGNNPTLWPDWTWKFRLMTRRFRESDYDLSPARRALEEVAIR